MVNSLIFYITFEKPSFEDSIYYTEMFSDNGRKFWIRHEIVLFDELEALSKAKPRENESVMNSHELPNT